MSAPDKKSIWLQVRRKSWSGFTGFPNRMIDSEAFLALKSVHSVKTLIWFWQMASYKKERRRPGQDSPIGNLKKIINANDLSFEYRVAQYRGLRPDQFARALRELYKYGFIDVVRLGRGIKGKWTQFAYSERWRLFGTPEWAEISYPDNFKEGYRSEAFKARRRREREEGKNNYGKSEFPTTERRSNQVDKKDNDYGNAELKTRLSTYPLTTISRRSSRSTRPVGSHGGEEKEGFKGLEEDRARGRPVSMRKPKSPVGGWVEEYETMIPGHDYGTEGTIH